MGRKYIEFRLNLDGVDYTQKVGFPDDIPIERIERSFKTWAEGIFKEQTGGVEGCELLLSNIKHNISN